MKDSSYLAHSPTGKQWQSIGIKHHHGIAVPLFSLHSDQSNGIGEYTDLPLLIDWCVSIGFDVVQLLPLNDTEKEASPYCAISAFALNPIYLGLHSLPNLDKYPALQEELKASPKFTNIPHLDYTSVREFKERFLKQYFQLEGKGILESEAYAHFIQCAYWLKGYAVFKILKRRNHWMSWGAWPEHDSITSTELINEIVSQEEEQFQWFCFLQFLCDQQMKSAKEYAFKNNVFLMGDIPILIGRDSVDVWLHKDLFNLDFSAGAPPDYFTETGQDWGFPVYQWQKLADQNYNWWVQRLQWASRYYHIYRIDHIVGFFRIWSIPLGMTAKHGYFIPQEENTWIDHGQKIMLMMIGASEMLPIGEDLGVVPPEVRRCLTALGICGTKVMRWERKWHEGGDFILLQDYPLESMTTVSTHDTEMLQQWWSEIPTESQLFAQFKGWSHEPKLSRDQLREILRDSHHTSSLFHINLLQEYLALIPDFSWPDPKDERINIPGLISEKNWCCRLRPSIEEMAQQSDLKRLMQELII